MSRPNLRRALAASASAALVAITLLASPVSAGNTRDVFFGTPGTSVDPDTGYGAVTYTATRASGLTATDIEIQNLGNQTLNHANLYGGYAADQAVENPLFPKPTDDQGNTLPSLSDGLTYVAVFAPSGVTCAIGPDGSDTPGRSLSCDLGQLVSGTSLTIRVVVETDGVIPRGDPVTTTFTGSTWYGLYLSETNSTGSNQDNFYATGSVTTLSSSCDTTNQDANYFLPGENVDLSTIDCATPYGQSATLQSRSGVAGQGGFGLVATGASIACPASYTCFGDGVTADVLDGTAVPGGLEWTVRWYGTRSLSGVVHFWDTYDPNDKNHKFDYTVIPFDKGSECSTASSVDCWVSTSKSKGNADPVWFEATFVTPDNGKIGGFI